MAAQTPQTSQDLQDIINSKNPDEFNSIKSNINLLKSIYRTNIIFNYNEEFINWLLTEKNIYNIDDNLYIDDLFYNITKTYELTSVNLIKMLDLSTDNSIPYVSNLADIVYDNVTKNNLTEELAEKIMLHQSNNVTRYSFRRFVKKLTPEYDIKCVKKIMEKGASRYIKYIQPDLKKLLFTADELVTLAIKEDSSIITGLLASYPDFNILKYKNKLNIQYAYINSNIEFTEEILDAILEENYKLMQEIAENIPESLIEKYMNKCNPKSLMTNNNLSLDFYNNHPELSNYFEYLLYKPYKDEKIAQYPNLFEAKTIKEYSIYVSKETFKLLNKTHGTKQRYKEKTFAEIEYEKYIYPEYILYLKDKMNVSNSTIIDLYLAKKNTDAMLTNPRLKNIKILIDILGE